MNQEINGVGVGREVFDILQKAARDGKVLHFVSAVSYSESYKLELQQITGETADGTCSIFGTAVDAGTHIGLLVEKLLEGLPADNAEAFGLGLVKLIVYQLKQRTGKNISVAEVRL